MAFSLVPLRLSALASRGLHFEDDEGVNSLMAGDPAIHPGVVTSGRNVWVGGGWWATVGVPEEAPRGTHLGKSRETFCELTGRAFQKGFKPPALFDGDKRSEVNNSWQPREGGKEKPGAWPLHV